MRGRPLKRLSRIAPRAGGEGQLFGRDPFRMIGQARLRIATGLADPFEGPEAVELDPGTEETILNRLLPQEIRAQILLVVVATGP